ncbi:MAG: alpha/beta hydrolase [Chitinophagaceae bacterium]|nr:alpha/beta hydrolase [Chitinophagaceae bacterium]
MKLFSAILLFLLNTSFVVAQNLSGITGIRDTAYSITNEYKKHLKNYPYITVVPDTVSGKIKEERNVTYSKIGKRELKMDVFYPAGKRVKKRTAIIFIHGGGWRSGDKSMHHQLMQRLALLGYVCFTPEYRLSTEALYPAAVHDIKSSVRWVRKKAKKYHVDTAAIVIAGHSAGGQLAALMGVTNDNPAFEGDDASHNKYSSRVNAVIDVDGTLSFIQNESSEMNDKQKRSFLFMAGLYTS